MATYGTPESLAAAQRQIRCVVDRSTGIATISLNRAEKHNALSVPMRRRLASLFRDLDTADDVRVIVIRGEGPSFSSGNEINEDWGQWETSDTRYTNNMAYRFSGEVNWGRTGYAQAVGRSAKITIAEVHGFCAAAAYFMLAMKCDLVIVADDTRIGALEARFLGPAGAVASTHIIRIIGLRAARRTGYTAAAMSGDEAVQVGLAAHCVPRDELRDTVQQRAEQIAARDPEELIALKARLQAAEGLLGMSVPAITGLLPSHFLQSTTDEMDFWREAKTHGVGAALDADKKRTGAVDPRESQP